MMRYFDWDKAKTICERNKGCEVHAGMEEDWYWTADMIYDGNKRVKCRPWLGSLWATPVCRVMYDDGSELTIPCWQEKEEVEMPDWWIERGA